MRSGWTKSDTHHRSPEVILDKTDSDAVEQATKLIGRNEYTFSLGTSDLTEEATTVGGFFRTERRQLKPFEIT